jgi:hypothetical protein
VAKTRMGECGVVVDSRGYELLVCCSGGSRIGVVILIEREQRLDAEFGGLSWLRPSSF